MATGCVFSPLLLLLLLMLVAAPLPTRCMDREIEELEFRSRLPSSIDADAFEYDEESKKFLLKQEACYGDLGCFSTTGKFFSLTKRPVVLVPQSPEKINIKFYLFTRLNPASEAELIYNNADSVLRSKFSNRRPTKLVIHGFLGDGLMSWMNSIRQAALRRVDCNLIQVDWSDGAKTLYNQATSNTRVVGAVVARMLTWLETRFGVNQNSVHLIGFSLGGQVAGYAGERLRTAGRPISRITGLDPAGPYFDDTDPIVRLDPTDAQFVDVVHTDSSHWSIGLPIINGGFGTKMAVGHVDFFVNGGHHQPGCSSLSACDHSRAPQLFIATLEQPSQYFAAFPCSDYDKFREGNCGSTCPAGGCPAMGYFADQHRARLSRGPLPHRHYLLTGGSSPYALVHFHVDVHLASSSPSGRSGKLSVELSASGHGCGPHELHDERNLEPRSHQRGVFACDWITKSVGSAVPHLKLRWTDGSTFGSWMGYSITVDSVTLTEMVAGRVHRYCHFGSQKGDVWVQGRSC